MALTSNTKALSTVAAAIANLPCRQINIHNNDAAINVLLGTSASQNFTLGPGQSSGMIFVSNANQLWAKSASATPTISYIAS